MQNTTGASYPILAVFPKRPLVGMHSYNTNKLVMACNLRIIEFLLSEARDAAIRCPENLRHKTMDARISGYDRIDFKDTDFCEKCK
jgi:hypothetical protein